MSTLARMQIFVGALASCALVPAAFAELVDELGAVIDQRQAIYAEDPNASPRVLEELWLDSDDIMLMSEEFHQMFYGRERVTPYFNPPEANLYAYREQISNLQAVLLEPDLATATYLLRYDMHPVGKPAMGGVSRMMTLFRKTDDGWKIQAELQLPMSLISQSRRLQEIAVSPDFVDYAKQQNPDYEKQVAEDPKLKRRSQGVVPWQFGGTSQPTAGDQGGGD